MSKKKKQNTFTKTFNKRVDIVTKDNSSYHITKTRMYICGSENEPDHYGKYYIITSNKYNKNNVHIITEFYDSASDNNRLRFRVLNLHNAKKFRTIEKHDDGTETSIAVVSYDGVVSNYICSIGDIKTIKTDISADKSKGIIDLETYIKKLQLILPKDYFNREEDTKKAA